jgi:hypothetical protein
MQQAFDQHMPRTGVVQVVTGNNITVTDPLTGNSESQLLPVFGPMPAVGERALILPLGDGSRIATRLAVQSGGGAIDIGSLTGIGANAGDVPVWDGSKFVPQVSGETLYNLAKSSTSVVASTAATSTWQEAITLTWALPAGVWQIEPLGWLRLKRGTAVGVDVRCVVDGNAGASVSATANATTFSEFATGTIIGGIVGNRNVDIILQFKGTSGTGTTTAETPILHALAKRTGA